MLGKILASWVLRYKASKSGTINTDLSLILSVYLVKNSCTTATTTTNITIATPPTPPASSPPPPTITTNVTTYLQGVRVQVRVNNFI